MSDQDIKDYRELVLHQFERMENCDKEQDRRLSSLEKSFARLLVIATIAGAIGGILLKYFGAIVLKKLGF